MNKDYHLLQEFAHVKLRCPRGVYLIPVPPKLQPSSPPPPQPVGQPTSRIQQIDFSPPSWQGIIFIRNETSPYFEGVFRFELNFASFAQIRQYLLPSATQTYRPYSFDWYPVVGLNSEIHSNDGQETRVAEYCLDGIERAEQDYISKDLPFSRVLHVLNRLVRWFDGEDVIHDVQLASTDVKVSKSDTLLYETARNDSRLITFLPDFGMSREVLDIFKRHGGKSGF